MTPSLLDTISEVLDSWETAFPEGAYYLEVAVIGRAGGAYVMLKPAGSSKRLSVRMDQPWGNRHSPWHVRAIDVLEPRGPGMWSTPLIDQGEINFWREHHRRCLAIIARAAQDLKEPGAA